MQPSWLPILGLRNLLFGSYYAVKYSTNVWSLWNTVKPNVASWYSFYGYFCDRESDETQAVVTYGHEFSVQGANPFSVNTTVSKSSVPILTASRRTQPGYSWMKELRKTQSLWVSPSLHKSVGCTSCMRQVVNNTQLLVICPQISNDIVQRKFPKGDLHLDPKTKAFPTVPKLGNI